MTTSLQSTNPNEVKTYLIVRNKRIRKVCTLIGGEYPLKRFIELYGDEVKSGDSVFVKVPSLSRGRGGLE